jgi:salicylate 5-hydroxylase small subunit
MTAVPSVALAARINAFNADYAAALDERRFADWPLFFAAQGRYTLRSRENHDRGLPLALMDLESPAMMQDRVYGISQTIYHQPYYTRHIVGMARVLRQGGNTAHAEAPYAVFRTFPAQASEVLQTGRYIDAFTEQEGKLLLASRLAVYDSEMVLNSVIYPI